MCALLSSFFHLIMPSKFTQVVQIFLFMGDQYFVVCTFCILYIHSLTDRYFSTFCLLWATRDLIHEFVHGQDLAAHRDEGRLEPGQQRGKDCRQLAGFPHPNWGGRGQSGAMLVGGRICRRFAGPTGALIRPVGHRSVNHSNWLF